MFTTLRPNRRSTRRLLAGAGAVVAVVGLSAGVSLAGEGDEPPPPAPSGNVHPGDSFDADELLAGAPVGQFTDIEGNGGIIAEALAPASTTLRYVPLAPCRAVDTRFAVAGKINADTQRTFTSVSLNMVNQGGSATGCKVPAWATAIGVNYAVVNPEGAGFGKAWQTGTPEPATSVINFQNTGNAATANSGVLNINPGGSGSFTTEFNRRVNLIVDITGFYVRDMYGSITFDGDVLTGSSLIDFVDHDPGTPGVYTVDFGAFVEGCVPHVTPSSNQFAAYVAQSADPNEQDQVVVDIEATDGAGITPGNNEDANFHVSITC